ncbi:heparan-alpha-glucosaminide N-acetyltransferase domain-containing protein [Geodermatophilus obscurus]|uniref:heparan-alpha-glucosaminide N-acetyltransferase domain-containing protein n=1 Tax=Geodermatophilus obscurus TaxID=1861 RepID=UPI001AD8EA16|nr:heparan-alpha-glucosaminide N-acetyltransferase domain-containing protein [Geodermatophilus obscurus]
MTPEVPPARPRVTGVDLARGLALFGMFAVHVFDEYTEQGPTLTGLVAAGRSAATFALVAGVSVAFLSGGRRILHGRPRRAAAAGLAVRAAGIGTIGLLLGYAGSDLDLILAYYAVFFLCAIPLIGLPAKALVALCATLVVVSPLVLVATARSGLPDSGTGEPTFGTLLTDPVGLLSQLFFTGAYPAVAYLAYLCAGLAIGRLDLTSRRLAVRLVGGGVGLIVAAQAVSHLLLHQLGGLDRLVAATGDDAPTVLWDADQGTTWDYLALAAPHTNTQLDLVNTLGSAMAVLGASLLLTRLPVAERLLRPVRAAGAMTLTLYSAHALVIATGVSEDQPLALYALLVVGALVWVTLWRRRRSQGPLEELVGRAAGRARQAVLDSPVPSAGAVAPE